MYLDHIRYDFDTAPTHTNCIGLLTGAQKRRKRCYTYWMAGMVCKNGRTDRDACVASSQTWLIHWHAPWACDDQRSKQWVVQKRLNRSSCSADSFDFIPDTMSIQHPPTCCICLLNGVQNGRTDDSPIEWSTWCVKMTEQSRCCLVGVASSPDMIDSSTIADIAHNHMLYRSIEWCAKTAEPMLDLLIDLHGVKKRQNRSRYSCDIIPDMIHSSTITDTAHTTCCIGRRHVRKRRHRC